MKTLREMKRWGEQENILESMYQSGSHGQKDGEAERKESQKIISEKNNPD